MSCDRSCRFLNAAGIAEALSTRGIACSERGVREMITKKKIPTFAVPFNGVQHVCEHVIDYMLHRGQARALQGPSRRTDFIPPPACLIGLPEPVDDESDD